MGGVIRNQLSCSEQCQGLPRTPAAVQVGLCTMMTSLALTKEVPHPSYSGLCFVIDRLTAASSFGSFKLQESFSCGSCS
jgi:hypothetical protein